MSYYRTLIQGNSDLFNKAIAIYKFEGNGNDSHTNALHGTVGSAVTFTSANAVDGLAGQFVNSVNSRITLPLTGNLLSFTTGTVDKPFSVKANVLRTASGVNQDIFSKYSTLSNASEYRIYVESASNLLTVILTNRVTGAYLLVRTTVPFPLNTMTNLIVNYNGVGTISTPGIEIYFNNVLQTLTNSSSGTYSSMKITTNPAVIGNKAASNNDPLRGTIDELYVFNAVLTSTERATLQTNYYPNI